MSAIKSVIATAVLSALLPVVSGEGFSIKNQCSFNVYYKVTTDQDSAITTVAPGQSASMPYTSKANGGGPSVKVGSSPAVNGDILQMEYTMAGSMLFYDISNINGLPFGQHNVQLSTNKDCPEVTCVAGQKCDQAYNVPSDDHATKACSLSGTDTVLTLCSDSSSSGGVGAVVGGVASAVGNAVAAAAPSQAQSNVNNNVAVPAPAAPTTLSTSVVAAAPTQAPAPAPAPVVVNDPAPVPVIVQSAPAAAPSAASNPSPAEEGTWNALHFPTDLGQGFSGDVKNFLKFDQAANVKRASRIHRHHAHLTAA